MPVWAGSRQGGERSGVLLRPLSLSQLGPNVQPPLQTQSGTVHLPLCEPWSLLSERDFTSKDVRSRSRTTPGRRAAVTSISPEGFCYREFSL